MNVRENAKDEMQQKIDKFIADAGGDPTTFKGELIGQIIQTALKLMRENHDLGQIKVIARSIKEMRYAYNIFNRYKDAPCVSIFGSVHTPENHCNYLAAKVFSFLMAKQGWMCITGAANGIVKAGLQGPKNALNFGLSILLPFESSSNTVIEGDPNSSISVFFFTRKLMFMTHSNALVAFPGGVGTLDELFEMLTLMQTGKANIIPVVLVEGKNGSYWEEWRRYMNDNLVDRGMIHDQDAQGHRRRPPHLPRGGPRRRGRGRRLDRAARPHRRRVLLRHRRLVGDREAQRDHHERPGARQRRHLVCRRRPAHGRGDRMRRRRRRARVPRDVRGCSATWRRRSAARSRRRSPPSARSPPPSSATPNCSSSSSARRTGRAATSASTSPGTSRATRSGESCGPRSRRAASLDEIDDLLSRSSTRPAVPGRGRRGPARPRRHPEGAEPARPLARQPRAAGDPPRRAHRGRTGHSGG